MRASISRLEFITVAVGDVVVGETVAVRCRLLGFCEADPVVAEVELRVVAAEEDVAQDPERPGRLGNVERHEAAQADRLPHLSHLQETSMKAAQCVRSLLKKRNYNHNTFGSRWSLLASANESHQPKLLDNHIQDVCHLDLLA